MARGLVFGGRLVCPSAREGRGRESAAVGVGRVVALLRSGIAAALPAARAGSGTRGGFGDERERRAGKHKREDEGLGEHGVSVGLARRVIPTVTGTMTYCRAFDCEPTHVGIQIAPISRACL